MNRIADLFEHSIMTIDDLDFITRKNRLTYMLLDDYNMRISDVESQVAFRVVVDDIMVHIFEAEY